MLHDFLSELQTFVTFRSFFFLFIKTKNNWEFYVLIIQCSNTSFTLFSRFGNFLKMKYLMRFLVRDHKIGDDRGSSGACWDGDLCVVVVFQRQVRNAVDGKHPDRVCAALLKVRQRHTRLRTGRRRRKRDQWRTNVTLNLVLGIGSATFVQGRIPGEHQGCLIEKSSS